MMLAIAVGLTVRIIVFETRGHEILPGFFVLDKVKVIDPDVITGVYVVINEVGAENEPLEALQEKPFAYPAEVPFNWIELPAHTLVSEPGETPADLLTVTGNEV